jgi:hypothetical protein
MRTELRVPKTRIISYILIWSILMLLVAMFFTTDPAIAATAVEQRQAQHEWQAELRRLNDEFDVSRRRGDKADLLGEGLAVTLNHVKWLIENAGASRCELQANAAYKDEAYHQMQMVAALYQTYTAFQGTSVDVSFFLVQLKEYYKVTLYDIDPDCTPTL